jgi:hypothetical protein
MWTYVHVCVSWKKRDSIEYGIDFIWTKRNVWNSFMMIKMKQTCLSWTLSICSILNLVEAHYNLIHLLWRKDLPPHRSYLIECKPPACLTLKHSMHANQCFITLNEWEGAGSFLSCIAFLIRVILIERTYNVHKWDSFNILCNDQKQEIVFVYVDTKS